MDCLNSYRKWNRRQRKVQTLTANRVGGNGLFKLFTLNETLYIPMELSITARPIQQIRKLIVLINKGGLSV